MNPTIQLLNREIPSDYLETYKRKIKKKPSKVEKKELGFFIFRLSKKWFALPVDCIKKITSFYKTPYTTQPS